jgi:hypothetical protein
MSNRMFYAIGVTVFACYVALMAASAFGCFNNWP